jgi:putative oxidoreductase
MSPIICYSNKMENSKASSISRRAVKAAYFLLRVVSGFLLMQAGGLILFGWYGGMPEGQTVSLVSQTGIGGILEFFGGILIILGLATRPVAFILSGMMGVAYWQFHAPLGRWPIQNNGMPAVLLCFIFLYMAARGAGEWSLDALVRRKSRSPLTIDE